MSNDIVDNLPVITGAETKPPATYSKYPTNLNFSKIGASFGIALHMHQPSIPAGGGDMQNAAIISNLQNMMENQGYGDNHNAPVFLNCYARLGDIIPELAGNGKNPRVMLDYSGNLLWGIRQMGQDWALDKMGAITCDKQYEPYVEWLGTMWSHAVATSTPIPDLKLHMMAWRHHFGALYGKNALARVRGFSPPEMHLPIHPDVCYEYIKALKESGFQWLLVQEHTIENLDGSKIRQPHVPHMLVAKNSLGEEQRIIALVKTQGSDTKLVAQMQPYYEAKSTGMQQVAGKNVFPFVSQIGDGENGGVMMNEFPPCFKQAYNEVGYEGVVGLNGSEYLDYIKGAGLAENDFPVVQPISQHRIWAVMGSPKAGACDAAIAKIKEKDQGFNLDKGSWTSDKNWVAGYDNVLDPINALSAAFHKKFDEKKIDPENRNYREALLYLLLSQTSCFRYWGQGIWTEYAKEICRRGMEWVKKG